MSKTVDSRVVEMRFDNKQFESNVKTSMSTLDKLKQKLKFKDSAKGLEDVGKAAKSFNMSGVSKAVDTIHAKFSALSVVGVTALANITNSAINAGKRIAEALTIDPIKTGFQEYETQINAVQTILANTSSKGTTLDQVNNALDQLNTYADKTIYNFTEMTRNIGTFTAAGVDLETSVSAIQGIANLAAVSGSTSQQASMAMYQLSQALAAGKVQLMDWNSVVNAGMGGEVFQNALKRTAKQMGKNVDEMITKYGSFRESLTKGEWLTTDVLTETLKQLSGAYSEADLIAQGYSESQAKEIAQLAQTAVDAATKVKTFSQLWDTLKEAAQSGWTQSWEIIIGDFEEAKAMLTEVSDVFGNIINESSNARNAVLQGWKDLGGRTALIDSFRNVFEGLQSIIAPISEAFKEIFPPITAQQLAGFTEGLKNLTSHLKISETTAQNLKSTFKGVFSVFDIVRQAVAALGRGFLELVGQAAPTREGILSITARIGEFISGINDAIKSSGIFKGAVSGITTALSSIINIISSFMQKIRGISDGGLFDSIGGIFSKVASKIGAALKLLKDNLVRGIKNLGFDGSFDLFNTGLFAALLLGIKKFIDKITDIAEGGAGILAPIKELLDGVKGCLEAWQSSLKSDILIKIAAAVGILAASLVALSMIDTGKLASAMTAMTISFGELVGAMTLLNKVASGKNFKGTSSLIGLAAAVLILSKAMLNISSLDWGQLAVGLNGMTVAMGELIGASMLLSKSGGGLGTAVTVIGIAAAMLILSKALSAMGGMSWSEIGKSLVELGGSLGILCAALNLMQSSIGGAVSLLIVAGALNALAPVLQQFAAMSLAEIGTSLLMLAGSLGILCAALALMQSSIGGAIALTLVAAGITLLSGALTTLSNLSIGQIIISLIGLAAALAVIGAASVIFSALIGPMLIFAGGLAAVSVAIMVFGAAMGILGTGLDSLAASLQVLSGVGDISSVALGITELAGALTLLGAAGIVSLIGDLGLLGLAAALAAVKAAAGDLSSNLDQATDAIKALTDSMDGISIADAGAKFIESFVSSIRNKISDVDGAIKDIEKTISNAFSDIDTSNAKSAGQKIVEGIADGIRSSQIDIESAISNIASTMSSSMSFDISSFSVAGSQAGQAFITGLQSSASTIQNSGLVLAQSALSGILTNVSTYTSAGTTLITALSAGMTSQSSAVTSVGTALGNAGATAVGNTSGQWSSVGGNIAAGLASGIREGRSSVISAAVEIATSALQAAKNALGIASPSRAFMAIGRYVGEGLAIGIRDSAHEAVMASEDMAEEIAAVAQREFEDIEKWVDEKKSFDEIGLAEQLELWNKVIERYEEGTEERLKAEKNAYDIYKQLQKENYQNSVDWIDREKAYNRMSLQEELEAWERVQARYIVGTEERENADRKVYELKHQLIENSIDAIQAEIDKQNELIAALQEGTVEYANAIKERTNLEGMLLEAQDENSKRWIQQQDDFDRWQGKTDKLAALMRKRDRQPIGSEKRLEYDKEIYDLEKEIYESYKQYQSDCADIQNEANEKRLELQQEYYDKEQEIYDKLQDDIDDLESSYTDAIQSRTDALYDAYGLFDKVEAKEPVNASDLMKNLQDQVSEFREWDDALDELSARGLNESLVEELQEMGPSAIAEIKALTTMSDSQLAEYATLWATKYDEAKERATDELEWLREDTNNQIEDLTIQASKDLSDYAEVWNEKMAEIDSNMHDDLQSLRTTFETEVGIIKIDTEKQMADMTSTVQQILRDAGWSDSGKYAGQEFLSGFSGALSSLIPSYIDNGTKITGNVEISHTMKKQAFYSGTEIAAGAASGALSAASECENAASSLYTAMDDTFREEGGIHSPSKKFAQLGKYLIDGLTLGMDNSSDKAVSVMSSLVGMIANIVDSDMDFSPTISPVVDMSNIHAGIGEMQSAFSAERSVNLGMSISQGHQIRSISEAEAFAAKLADANARSDSNILSAIEEIKNDFGELVNRLSNLQVVMDTGTLVGAITPEMDRSLGVAAMLNRRGVR